MANYKEIQGFPIQNLSSDPVPFAQEKQNNPYAGTWASGTSINTARQRLSGAGLRTANVVFGGAEPGYSAKTEVWDGSSWTESGDLATARYNAGAVGVYTAAIAAGGFKNPTPGVPGNTDLTEQWDGSSWTEIAEINTARRLAVGMGTTTAGLIAGGIAPPAPATGETETWNGTAWTEVADLNTARGEATGSGAGSTTAGLVFGGVPQLASTESWNGTAWSEVNDLNTGREELAGNGTSTSALGYGGNTGTPKQANTESWDGTSWTEVNDLAVGKNTAAGVGASNQSAMNVAGDGPAVTNTVEEWTFTGIAPDAPAAGYADAITGQMYYNSTTGQFKAIKVGTASWSSGGNLPTGRYRTKAMGTQTATLAALGSAPPGYNNTSLHYDGSSWTESQALNRAPGVAGGAGGTQTAAIIGGGYNSGGPSPNSLTTQTEIYDGTSWTEVNDMNTGRSGQPGTGSTTAALVVGGATSVVSPSHPSKSITGATETWDGTNWTEVADLNTARESFAGSQSTNPYTTALCFGGTKAPYPPGTRTGETELWNGSAWTEVADLNTSRETESGGAGTSGTQALCFGGYTTTQVASTEEWDGTSWTEVNDLSTARYGIGGTGSTTSAIAASGGPVGTPANLVATEEWTLPDFEINTLTTS